MPGRKRLSQEKGDENHRGRRHGSRQAQLKVIKYIQHLAAAGQLAKLLRERKPHGQRDSGKKAQYQTNDHTLSPS